MSRITALAVLFSLLLSYTGAPAQQTGSFGPDAVSLQPGDLIRIQIWREEDLGGEFLVDEKGVVVLPLLGEQKVTDVPVGRLRSRLLEEYRAHLRNPSINIVPLRRINVLGEVQKPGLYPVDPTVSLAGAVAIAGGATPLGDISRIRILRDGQEIRRNASAAETLSSVDIRSGDQIVVDRRSWFDRNSTFLVSVLLSVTSIVTTIILSQSSN